MQMKKMLLAAALVAGMSTVASAQQSGADAKSEQMRRLIEAQKKETSQPSNSSDQSLADKCRTKGLVLSVCYNGKQRTQCCAPAQ